MTAFGLRLVASTGTQPGTQRESRRLLAARWRRETELAALAERDRRAAAAVAPACC